MPHVEIFLQLPVSLPEEPKVRALARYGRDARALRDLYVQMQLYCKRAMSDGHVPGEEVGVLVYPDTPKNGVRDANRLVEAGLMERTETGFFWPGFLARNKSRDQIVQESADKVARKSEGGSIGNHRRWHEDRGIVKGDCQFCTSGSVRRSDTDRSAIGSSDSDPVHIGSRSDNGSETDAVISVTEMSRDQKVMSEPYSDRSLDDPNSSHAQRSSQVADPKSIGSTDRIAIASDRTETETETETETTPPPDPLPTDAPSSTAEPKTGGGGGNPPTRENTIIDQVRALRPEWSTTSIRRALQHPDVQERPWSVIADAVIEVAKDPATTAPGRLAADGPWWAHATTVAKPAGLPKCPACNPFRRLEADNGDDLGPCPTCHPSNIRAVTT